jgi:exodeoxyribonuclease VII small subunit
VAKKSAATKSGALPNFEAALAELEKLVKRMESGEQSLEQTLKDFERGMELTRLCQKGLKEAEQRVDKLVKKNNEITTEPFEDSSTD